MFMFNGCTRESLLEGEGLVQLTTIYFLVQILCWFFYKRCYLNKEVNRTDDPFPSVRVPWLPYPEKFEDFWTVAFFQKPRNREIWSKAWAFIHTNTSQNTQDSLRKVKLMTTSLLFYKSHSAKKNSCSAYTLSSELSSL